MLMPGGSEGAASTSAAISFSGSFMCKRAKLLAKICFIELRRFDIVFLSGVDISRFSSRARRSACSSGVFSLFLRPCESILGGERHVGRLDLLTR